MNAQNILNDCEGITKNDTQEIKLRTEKQLSECVNSEVLK